MALALEALPDPEERRALLASLAADYRVLLVGADAAEVSRLLQVAGVRIWVEAGDVVDATLG